MATFPLNTFMFTSNSDVVVKSELGTAISNSALVKALEGNDSISGMGNSESTREGGEIVGIDNLTGGTIDMGIGNDSITGAAAAGRSSFSVGIRNQGKIDMGAGSDSISGTSFRSGIHNTGSIDTGAGNDKIDGIANVSSSSKGVYNRGTIEMSGGNDSLSGAATSGGEAFFSSNGIGIDNASGTINMGTGNDSISGSTTYVGGNDFVSNGTGIDNTGGTINMGTGNDSISGTASATTAPQDGVSRTGINNTNGIIDTGAGNDSIFGTASAFAPTGSANADGIDNTNGKIDMGTGNDSITGSATRGLSDAINNAGGTIAMGAGNDSILGTVTNAIFGNSYGLSNSGTIDAGTGSDNLFFAVSNIAGKSEKVTINGGGKIFMGLGNDSFQGFGSMTVYGDAGAGNTSNQDTLNLSMFNSSEFIIEKIGIGDNYAKFIYNDPSNPLLPATIMTTNEFDKFIFADRTVNYALLT